MRTVAFTLLFSFGVVSAEEPKKKTDAEADLKKMQGTWVVEKATYQGKEMPADAVKGLSVTIKGDVYTSSHDPKHPMKITLDPSHSPSTIDLKEQGTGKLRSVLGIYQFSGESLVLCIDDGDGRPKEFKSPSGSKVTVMHFVREKK